MVADTGRNSMGISRSPGADHAAIDAVGPELHGSHDLPVEHRGQPADEQRRAGETDHAPRARDVDPDRGQSRSSGCSSGWSNSPATSSRHSSRRIHAMSWIDLALADGTGPSPASRVDAVAPEATGVDQDSRSHSLASSSNTADSEGHVVGPPQDHRQVVDEQRRDGARQVLGQLAADPQHDLLGADLRRAALRHLAGRVDVGLERRRAVGVGRRQDRPRATGAAAASAATAPMARARTSSADATTMSVRTLVRVRMRTLVQSFMWGATRGSPR